jgi:hypothetical protein
MPELPPLSVAEAPHFEDRWARAKLVLVWLMGLIVLAGLAGAFGRGPLSRASAEAPAHGATVSYERVQGKGTPGQILVELKRASPDTQADITLDPALAEHLSLTTTQPRSSAEWTSAEGETHRFLLGPHGRGKVVLFVQPSKPGLVHGALTLNGERVPINLLIWP